MTTDHYCYHMIIISTVITFIRTPFSQNTSYHIRATDELHILAETMGNEERKVLMIYTQ